jgi:hypothetical protein
MTAVQSDWEQQPQYLEFDHESDVAQVLQFRVDALSQQIFRRPELYKRKQRT